MQNVLYCHSMNKTVLRSLLAALSVGTLLTLTGTGSALVSAARGGRDDDNNKHYGKVVGRDGRRNDNYGGGVCDEFEEESEVNEHPDRGRLHLKRDKNDDQMNFDNETKVFGGSWKDLDDKPTVIVRGHKCHDDNVKVCDSITIVRKNKKD